MPFKATNENGDEIDAYSPEEWAAKEAEIATAKTDAETARTEAENLRKVNLEKTDNFKKLNEMSEKEKEAYSAKELENMKRVEAAEARAQALEDKVNENEKTRIAHDKEKALFKYHGGNKELKESLEKNFDMINLVGDSTDIIEERARLAANMEKGKIGAGNPLMANLNGEAPSIKQKGETEKFMESDKAKKALELMGDKPEPAK